MRSDKLKASVSKLPRLKLARQSVRAPLARCFRWVTAQSSRYCVGAKNVPTAANQDTANLA